MTIFLIRHAQSQANNHQRTQNHHDIQLSDQGHLQARSLLTQLPKIDHVIVSSFTRTLQTAQPVLDRYALRPEVNNQLHEFSYLSERKCQNTNMDERKAWADAYWQRMDTDYQDADDAESFANLYDRVEQVSQQLKLLQPLYQHKHLAIFSHGQFLQLLIMYIQQYQPLSTELMQQFRALTLKQPIANIQIFEYSKL